MRKLVRGNWFGMNLGCTDVSCCSKTRAGAALVERVFSAVLDFQFWGLPLLLNRCPPASDSPARCMILHV